MKNSSKRADFNYVKVKVVADLGNCPIRSVKYMQMYKLPGTNNHRVVFT